MKKLVAFIFIILVVGASSEQTLKKGAVISINYITFVLKPDVPLYEFVDFMIKKHIPEFEKNFPGVKEYLLWGDKGVNKYQLAVMEVYGSVAMRDKYWKDIDVPTDEGKSAKEKMEPLFYATFNYLEEFNVETIQWIIK